MTTTSQPPEPTQEELIAAFLKKLPSLRAKHTPPAKPWQKIVGAIPNDPMVDEAYRLGAEWRAKMNQLPNG